MIFPKYPRAPRQIVRGKKNRARPRADSIDHGQVSSRAVHAITPRRVVRRIANVLSGLSVMRARRQPDVQVLVPSASRRAVRDPASHFAGNHLQNQALSAEATKHRDRSPPDGPANLSAQENLERGSQVPAENARQVVDVRNRSRVASQNRRDAANRLVPCKHPPAEFRNPRQTIQFSKF